MALRFSCKSRSHRTDGMKMLKILFPTSVYPSLSAESVITLTLRPSVVLDADPPLSSFSTEAHWYARSVRTETSLRPLPPDFPVLIHTAVTILVAGAMAASCLGMTLPFLIFRLSATLRVSDLRPDFTPLFSARRTNPHTTTPHLRLETLPVPNFSSSTMIDHSRSNDQPLDVIDGLLIFLTLRRDRGVT